MGRWWRGVTIRRASATCRLDLRNVVAVAGGGAHSLALTADGTVAAWGANWNGQCNLPSGLGDVVGMGAGEYHSLALRAGTIPVPLLLSLARQGSRFSVLVQTLNRTSYALETNNSLATTNWSAVSTNTGNGALEVERPSRHRLAAVLPDAAVVAH